MKPIIFLDIDGPLMPLRTLWLPANRNGQSPTIFDPIAVNLIEDVADRADASYVISSSWAVSPTDRSVIDIFLRNGFSNRFHADWMTPRELGSLTQSRGLEISHWLLQHAECCVWAAIDDAPPETWQTANWVRVEYEEGFGFVHYKRLKQILGLPESKIFFPPTRTN